MVADIVPEDIADIATLSGRVKAVTARQLGYLGTSRSVALADSADARVPTNARAVSVVLLVACRGHGDPRRSWLWRKVRTAATRRCCAPSSELSMSLPKIALMCFSTAEAET